MKKQTNFNIPNLTPAQRSAFLKKLSLKMHSFYKGKIMTAPKVPLPSTAWLDVWYTPGVSAVSTAIRDDNSQSFELSNRGNMVAVVSDSTRVLGDGDCTPPGGLGVMEGKAFLMKVFAGIDALALCVDSKLDGKANAQKIIDCVKAISPSFGAINLEDISQPNCYEVLDTLRAQAEIPVWHDDAQGTACIVAAGFLNAVKLAGKKLDKVKVVIVGAGASGNAVADLLLKMGVKGGNMAVCDSKGALHAGRTDVRDKPGYYKQWALCQKTNFAKIPTAEEAFKGADAAIALSTPGSVKKEWIKTMAKKAIVFTCSNPIPEVYPDEAKEMGAYITATGRGDFDNQLNNALCFPGILKGALLCGAKTISDGMIIAASKEIAASVGKKIKPSYIVPSTKDSVLPARVAAAVASAAAKEKLARRKISGAEVYRQTLADIKEARAMYGMMSKHFIKAPPQKLIKEALAETLKEEKSAHSKRRKN